MPTEPAQPSNCRHLLQEAHAHPNPRERPDYSERSCKDSEIVAALAGLSVVDHGLIHAVEVDGGSAPDNGFDCAALDCSAGDVFGR
jgi:hypothetical protein